MRAEFFLFVSVSGERRGSNSRFRKQHREPVGTNSPPRREVSPANETRPIFCIIGRLCVNSAESFLQMLWILGTCKAVFVQPVVSISERNMNGGENKSGLPENPNTANCWYIP